MKKKPDLFDKFIFILILVAMGNSIAKCVDNKINGAKNEERKARLLR